LYFDLPDIDNINHRFSVDVGDVAPDRAETPLPAAHLLLRDVTAFAETMCLPGGFLAMTVSLAPLLRPSGFTSQCYKVQRLLFWFGLYVAMAGVMVYKTKFVDHYFVGW
jgi:hypothetical protein